MKLANCEQYLYFFPYSFFLIFYVFFQEIPLFSQEIPEKYSCLCRNIIQKKVISQTNLYDFDLNFYVFSQEIPEKMSLSQYYPKKSTICGITPSN